MMTTRIATVTVPEETKQVTVLVCDFCGYETESQREMKTCCLCRRHACRPRSTKANDCALPDPYEHGDYPDYYCPMCYRLRFETYSQEFSDIEEEYERKKDALTERVRVESLATLPRSDPLTTHDPRDADDARRDGGD